MIIAIETTPSYRSIDLLSYHIIFSTYSSTMYKGCSVQTNESKKIKINHICAGSTYSKRGIRIIT